MEMEIFETVNEVEIQPEKSAETTEINSSDNSVEQLLNEFKKSTVKDEKGGAESATGATASTKSTAPKTETTAPEPRKKAALMFCKLIDLVISMGCSIIVDEARDKYKAVPDDLKELAEQMHEYEIATGKKIIASPLTNIILTGGVVWGESVYNAVGDYRAKRAVLKNVRFKPIETTAGNEKNESTEVKRSNLGGYRPGAGRKKGTKNKR